MHFFLSYRRDDLDVAREIANALKKAGVNIWMDVEACAIALGAPVTPRIEEGLLTSHGFIIVVGTRTIDRWVRMELDAALNRHVDDESYRIVPILLDDVRHQDLPPFLRRFNAASLPRDPRALTSKLQPVIDQLTGQSDTALASVEDDTCPFPGMEAFDTELSQFFLGRHTETLEALSYLGRGPEGHIRWLQVEGASGVGKSSLVRAGLVPSVQRGWIESGPQQWSIATLRPGRKPILNLAAALFQTLKDRELPTISAIEQRLRSDEAALRDILREFSVRSRAGFLLVVDQFEELFTLAEANELKRFDLLLHHALIDVDGPFYMVNAVRSDFLLRFSELPNLESDLNTRAFRYYLRNMDERGLRDAVFGAVELAGLRWESRHTAERIITEAKQTIGGLPLVGYILRALWERKNGRMLTSAAYLELGLAGALASGADSLLKGFGDEGIARIRSLLLSLVKIGGGPQDTRRVVSRQDAIAAAGGDDRAEDILVRLSGGREPGAPATAPTPPRIIVVSGDDSVELAHEFLISGWPTLRKWHEDARLKLRIRDDLDGVAQAWYAANCPLEGLAAGDQLGYFNQLRENDAEGDLALRQIAVPNAYGANYLAAANEIEFRRRKLSRLAERLNRHLQLSIELEALLAEEQILWPAIPEKSGDMETWLATARRMTKEGHFDKISEAVDADDNSSELKRLEKFRDAATRLPDRESKRGGASDIRPVAALNKNSEFLGHETAALEVFLDEHCKVKLRQKEVNQKIENMLDALTGTSAREPGLITKLEERLRFAKFVVELSIAQRRELWQEAIKSISDPLRCPLYRGLKIEPQVGLVPIRLNSKSGLWEFGHLQTGVVPQLNTDGDLILTTEVGLVFVLIPGGTFHMGAVAPTEMSSSEEGNLENIDPDARPEEGPVHPVTLAPFFLSKYQMTQAQWARIAGENPSIHNSERTAQHPVENVSWNMCSKVLAWLGLELPTEPQWEYATRGGSTTVWWSGNDQSSLLNAALLMGVGQRQPFHVDVGSFRPNGFGLHDTAGNIWEWCRDFFDLTSYEKPIIDLEGNRLMMPTSVHVNRGGSYFSPPIVARSACRSMGAPEYRAIYVGLRPCAKIQGLDYHGNL